MVLNSGIASYPCARDSAIWTGQGFCKRSSGVLLAVWDKDPRRALGCVWGLKELRLRWLSWQGEGRLSPLGLSFSRRLTPASSRGVLGQ